MEQRARRMRINLARFSSCACVCCRSVSVNADLLPTRPPPKNYVATGEPEFALLLSPGLGKGCNLKKFPNLRQFLQEDAKY